MASGFLRKVGTVMMKLSKGYRRIDAVSGAVVLGMAVLAPWMLGTTTARRRG